MLSALESTAAVFCSLSLVYFAYQRYAAGRTVTLPTADKLEDKPGSLPDPDPLHDFVLETAHTRNHIYVNKTLRYPYFQTMAHQPMHINDWIEIDKDYRWYLNEKEQVIKEHGKVVVDSLPENDDACAELLETLVEYLPKRYPTLFERIGVNGIWNKVTGEKFDDLTGKSGVDALLIVSKLVQDDFLMGREREDGHVYFVGGLVAFPGFYTLSHYIGQPLEQVHINIPYFNEKILMSVERTLKRFKSTAPFERSSWGIADDRNLFCHNMMTTMKLPDGLQAKDMWLRMDHQTFRKLPRSNGIAFGVHVMQKRLEDLADSPLVPALLTKIHLEADKELMHHKLDSVYRERLMPYLVELTKSQLDRGLIKEEDLERVQDFRGLVQDGIIPNPQTSLSRPTESEIAMSGGAGNV
ncbi:hypothetical protein EW146_g509 [Bondarzewia mesenterica]|uniref:Uncharacterized protein n=1 Tax=Bondarzewia mesenterica TaxID=1095465 RepID=A0A4S4M6Q9_9AGAM|nr:hypothetical protein EW146_g509 [Bondarzewia mesenterica]